VLNQWLEVVRNVFPSPSPQGEGWGEVELTATGIVSDLHGIPFSSQILLKICEPFAAQR